MDRINLCQISSGTGTARRTDEQQTFYDIMPRVLFYTSASNFIGQFEPRHLQFVKEVVVPAFLRLSPPLARSIPPACAQKCV